MKSPRTKPCPTCDGEYEVHDVNGAKPIHKDFPNVLVARTDNHWMFNLWLVGADGRRYWKAWVPASDLKSYIQALRLARTLQELGGLMPSEDG